MTSTLAACCTKFFSWNYKKCIGNHPNDCAATLFYPDWEGGSGKCVADGKEPAYMNTNSQYYLFNNLPDCCKAFYSWDYYNCVGMTPATNPLPSPDSKAAKKPRQLRPIGKRARRRTRKMHRGS